MRINRLYYQITGLLLLMLLCACTKNRGVVVQQESSQTTNSNRLETKGANDRVASTSQTAGSEEQNRLAVLQGTYTISEVQHDGIVEMISPENSTEITFKQPSSFSRLSKTGGRINHTDSGQYKVDGKNLILKIVMSKNQIQLKPVEKRFIFLLSPDGEELKLTSDNKRTAIFRRSKAPVPSQG